MSEHKPESAPSFDLDPEQFRELGHQLIDLMTEALQAERQDPVLRPASGAELAGRLDEPLPRHGSPPADVLAQWGGDLLQSSRRNGHPRFFAYVCGSADPVGILADAFTAALNQNLTAWRSSPPAVQIERLVVRWLDQMVGFDGEGHGLLVSGGSAANANAIACAMNRAAHRAPRDRLTVYLSREGHVSLKKSVLGLGIPLSQIRQIAVDGQRRMRLADLERALTEDRQAGLEPALVGASAGTANAGTIDPLEEIAELAGQHGAWFHIDGAYGAPAALTEPYRWMRRAFARADSLSLDPHKWLFAPIDAGCALVRDPEATRQTFNLSTEYIEVTQNDPIERWAFFEHGTELTRRFRALKVWTILKVRGTEGLAQAIGRNIELRQRIDRRVEAEPDLELLASELSITCFRLVPPGYGDDALNDLNRQVLETLVRAGRVYLSPTTLEGRYALRVCIVNFRTSEADVDFLIDEVLRIGSELV